MQNNAANERRQEHKKMYMGWYEKMLHLIAHKRGKFKQKK